MIMHLMSIGSNDNNVSKMFNAGRDLLARCVKYHGLTIFFIEPGDENVISQISCEAHQFHKNIGHYYAVL